MQSQAMEMAFANVETCIGHTDDDAFIGSDERANTFATWIALHGLRNARNADNLKNCDYKTTVEELAHHHRQHYAFFLKRSEDTLITCDNPITKLTYKDAGEDKELFFAPLNPRRAVVIVQDDKMPVVSPPKWNELTFRNATALADPTLELHDSNGATISNDDWRETQESEIIATTIPPNKDQEPAILATLAPGNYTAVVRGKNNTTGIGLVEAYNLQ